MGSSPAKLEIQIAVNDKAVKPSLSALSAEVKKLGLMTEAAFSGKNMELLGVKPIAEVRAEMAKLTTAYRDVATSGKISAADQGRALDALRAKQRELYAAISSPPKNQQAYDTLGIKSQRDITAEINKTKQAYATLAASGKLSTAELARAKIALGRRLDEINGKIIVAKNSSLGLGKVLAGTFTIGAAAYYANQVRIIADQYTNINARLKLVTESTAEYKQVQDELYRISQQTGSEYASNASSFAKLSMAMKNVGASSGEILKINELVNKSLVISGAQTSEVASFMLQFSQAMGSGVLQGEEFRAMMEANSYFGALLAKALDTDIAGLRQMSKDGKLTSDVLRGAFPKMADEINTAFAKIPATTQRALTALQNAFNRIIDDSNSASNGTGKISTEIINLGETIDRNREGIISLFSSIIAGAGWATNKLGEISTVLQGTKAILSGDLGFKEALSFKNAAELNAWLEKNVKAIEEQKAAHEKVAVAATSSTNTQKVVYKKVTKEIEDQYRALADKVKGILDEISGRQQSLTAELREMGRAGMSDLGAWQDLKAEADEYYAAAQAAAKAGDFELAKQKADEAKAKYKELNRAVEENGQTVITQEQAKATAMEGVKNSGDIAIKVLEAQAQTAKETAAALDSSTGGQLAKSLPEVAKQFGELKEKADNLGKSADEFNKNWDNAWDRAVLGGEAAIAQLEKDLKELTKDRTVTIHVKEVQEKSTGGQVGYRYGGLIQALAAGGSVARNILAGGFLPGFGGGDRRLLLGEDGEVMLNKNVVQLAGKRAALAFNAGRWDVVISELMQRFKFNMNDVMGYQLGGMISSLPSVQTLSGGGAVEVTGPNSSGKMIRHEHVLRAGNVSAKVFTDDLNAGRLLAVFERAARMSS